MPVLIRRAIDVPNGTIKRHVEKGRIINVPMTYLLDVLDAFSIDVQKTYFCGLF